MKKLIEALKKFEQDEPAAPPAADAPPETPPEPPAEDDDEDDDEAPEMPPAPQMGPHGHHGRHRGLHHFIGLAIPYVCPPGGVDPKDKDRYPYCPIKRKKKKP